MEMRDGHQGYAVVALRGGIPPAGLRAPIPAFLKHDAASVWQVGGMAQKPTWTRHRTQSRGLRVGIGRVRAVVASDREACGVTERVRGCGRLERGR